MVKTEATPRLDKPSRRTENVEYSLHDVKTNQTSIIKIDFSAFSPTITCYLGRLLVKFSHKRRVLVNLLIWKNKENKEKANNNNYLLKLNGFSRQSFFTFCELHVRHQVFIVTAIYMCKLWTKTIILPL